MDKIAAWFGLLCIQSNVLPTLYGISIHEVSVSIASVVLMITGLSGYLYYSVIKRDTFYIFSNALALCFNILILYLVW